MGQLTLQNLNLVHIANMDFKMVNTTIYFNSSSIQGQSLCVDIDIINDNNVEYSDEYFNVTLISIDTVHTVIQIPQASVHIQEDMDDGNKIFMIDVLEWNVLFSVVSIGFVYMNYSVYEGLSAIVCAVILNGTIERPVSVFTSSSQNTAIRESYYSIHHDGLCTYSCAENVDYQGMPTQELIFPPGSTTNTTVCINITTYNNTIIQYDRTFAVNMQRIDPSVVLSGIISTTVIIKQNHIDSK